jgi:ribosomal protein L37AE/L43A
MRKQLSRRWRRLVLAYQVRCAREDAKLRRIVTPIGVWVCARCPHVSLSTGAYLAHLAGAHA